MKVLNCIFASMLLVFTGLAVAAEFDDNCTTSLSNERLRLNLKAKLTASAVRNPKQLFSKILKARS